MRPPSGPLISGDRLAWVLGLNVIASTILTGGARLQQLHVRTDPDRLRPRERRPYSLLPYVAIGATYLLLVVVLARVGLDGRSWLVVAGAITSTGLVVARQIMAFADNGRLVADLTSSLRERDRLAARLTYLAYHDNLTGLANRALFQQELDAAAAKRETPAAQLVVMLVDLDDFKPVNDTFGHAAGDELLVQVGARLRRSVRDGDLVARMGGDEVRGAPAAPGRPRHQRPGRTDRRGPRGAGAAAGCDGDRTGEPGRRLVPHRRTYGR